MQAVKSTGMGIGSLQHLAGPDADTGIPFSAAGSATTHLGIPLRTDPAAAARTLYTAILQRLHRRIFFFFWWKKAYMSIDANHVSNPIDR